MRYLNHVCVGIALAGLTTSAILWRELRAQRELMTEWQKAHSFAASGAPPTAGPATILAIPAPGSVAMEAGRAAEAPASRIDQEVARSRERLEDPEFRENALLQLRLVTPLGFPGLVEELGLSADAASRLFDLLAEHQLEMNALPVLARDDAVSFPVVRETAVARQEMQSRQEGELAAHLGNDLYGKWKEYQETRSARQQAAQVGATMQSQGQPLSQAQELALRAVLVAENRRQRREMQDMLGNVSRPSPADPTQLIQETYRRRAESGRRILEAVEPHLSAPQLELLRVSLDQQLAVIGAANRSGR